MCILRSTNRSTRAAGRSQMYVGRDTAALDKEGVIKAAVETVAENTTDGVVSPLIFMLIGGAPLGGFCIRRSTRWTPWSAIIMTNTNIWASFPPGWTIYATSSPRG